MPIRPRRGRETGKGKITFLPHGLNGERKGMGRRGHEEESLAESHVV